MNSTEQQKQECAGTSAELGSTEKIKRKPAKIEVGSVWSSKNCGKFKVTKYVRCNSIYIKFLETGGKIVTSSDSVRKGCVRDPLIRVVQGVGFIGSGVFKSKINNKSTDAYGCWRNMLIRCYGERYQKEKPSYIGCTVCEEWHNFQNFAKWYYANHPQDGEKWHLDKDFTVIGNKIYSPETCAFIPASVNSFITDCARSRGEFNIGVTFARDRKMFRASCQNPFSGEQERIGQYKSELEGHLAWRKRKSQHCDSLIDKYDSEIVKSAIRNYKYALDNNLIYTY